MSTQYGILRSNTNTGLNSELIGIFSAPLTIESDKPVLVNETLSLKRKVAYTDIQRWKIETGLLPVDSAIELFLHSVTNGFTEPFAVRMPQIYRTATISSNLNPNVVANVQASLDTLQVSNIGASILPVGEFIKFNNHSKVYLIKESTSLGGGINQIKIFPKLLRNITALENITYGAKVTMTALYDFGNKSGISYSDGIITSYEGILLVEAL